MKALSLIPSLLVAVLCGAAQAAVAHFPVEGAYRPWPCGSGPMTDPAQDQGASFELDLVGDAAAPAGLRAADADFLYLRIRLDRDPAPHGNLSPSTWGLLVDTDGDASTYEAALLVDGFSGVVSLYKNTSGSPGDATDPFDQPAVRSASWTLQARTAVAAGSAYGGDPDTFLEVAFAWTDLALVGIHRTTPIRVWEATSTSHTKMDRDFACSTGVATLDATMPRTVADPLIDSDGDGFSDATEVQNGTDPASAASHPTGASDVPRLTGGACGGHAAAAGFMPTTLLLGVGNLLRRRSKKFLASPSKRE